MENTIANSENVAVQPSVQDEMKQRLGSKYIGEGVTITDNLTNRKFKIVSMNPTEIIITEIVSIGKGETTPILYSELLKKFDKSEIDVAGYGQTEGDKILFHQVIREIMSGHDMTEKNNVIAQKDNAINELVTEEGQFKSGGVIGKITYNKNGTVKEVKNQFGKNLLQVMVGEKIYERNVIDKTYNSVDGGELLRKEDVDKIKIVKKAEANKIKEKHQENKNQIEESVKRIIQHEIIANQSSLVDKLLSDNIVAYDDIQNYYVYPEWSKKVVGEDLHFRGGSDDEREIFMENFDRLKEESEDLLTKEEISENTHDRNIVQIDSAQEDFENETEESQPQEIYEWWLITDWLKDKLLAQGEPIIDSDYGTWWGRTSTGQNIILDGVIQDVVKKMNPEKLKRGKKISSAKTVEVDTRYNGWKNYETWNVKLWIDNEEGSHNYWNERADEIYKESKKDEIFTKKENARYELGQELEIYFRDNNPLDGQASTYTDLLGSALQKVDWIEIAENMLAEKKGCGGDVTEEMAKGGEVGREFKYLKLIPQPNGLEIRLTKDGWKKVEEDGITFDNAPEYFEDIQGNSEYIYHDDLGESGLGMPRSEGITDGYHFESPGEFLTDFPESAKVYWFPNYQVQFWGDILTEEGSVFFMEAKESGGYMEKGGRVDITSNFYRFRQHSPKGVTTCATPEWGMKVGETVKKGSEIRSCKKDGKWFIQSILIPKDGVKLPQARKMANEIKSKLSRKKKALGGVAETCTFEDIEKTKNGLRVLSNNSKNQSEKDKYQRLLQDLD